VGRGVLIGTWLGLPVLFRDRYDRQGRTEKALSDNAFSVYIFHAPVIIGLGAILVDVALYPQAKFALLSVLSIVITLAFSVIVVRRIPT
jgi:glucan biosynthesis protein C